MHAVMVDDLYAVDEEPAAVVATQEEGDRAGLVDADLARPPDGKSVVEVGESRESRPEGRREVDPGIHPRVRRREGVEVDQIEAARRHRTGQHEVLAEKSGVGVDPGA